MNALLTATVLWLAANCGLPASFEHPTIERVPLERMSAQRFARSGAHGSFAHGEHEGQAPRQIVAIYNDHRRTIYLPEGHIPQKSCFPEIAIGKHVGSTRRAVTSRRGAPSHTFA